MIKNLILTLESPTRDHLNVYSYQFKTAEHPSVAIITGFLGDELLQTYTASQLIQFLLKKSKADKDFIKGNILIIPAVNNFGFNIAKRYWPFDNTDIRKMFPGYDKGETTQRIAHSIFDKIKDYHYGIKLSGGNKRTAYIPHVRLFKTGNEDIESAKLFGLKYINLLQPDSNDTVKLTYNWQIWGCHAYSLFAGQPEAIDFKTSDILLDTLIRFLSKINAINYPNRELYQPSIISEEDLIHIKSPYAGFIKPFVEIGDIVHKGKVLGQLQSALEGNILGDIIAPQDGIVFSIYTYSLIYQNTIAFSLTTR